MRVLILLILLTRSVGFRNLGFSPSKTICTTLNSQPPRDHFELLKDIVEWSKGQTLESVAPRATVDIILSDVRETNWDNQFEKYSLWFDKIEAAVRSESKSIEQVLGANSTASVLSLTEKIDIDPVSFNTFLKQPAFEEIIGTVIYEAIFTFLEKVDILGNIVNQLPIIGPIRKQINEQIKKSLDATLGKQIKAFLVDYNRVAISRIAELALSPSNRVKISKANRSLVTSLLKRPVKSYVPSPEDMKRLKLKLWETLIGAVGQSGMEISALLDRLYVTAGTDKLQDVVDLDMVLESSPALRELLVRNLQNLLYSPQGNNLILTATDLVGF